MRCECVCVGKSKSLRNFLAASAFLIWYFRRLCLQQRGVCMTRNRVWTLVLLCTSMILGACVEMNSEPSGASSDGDEIALVRQGIQGGQTDTSHPSIMGLVSLSGGGLGICTGSLIAPNLVLTAQHCVSSDVPEIILCGSAEFGRTTPAGNLYFTPDTNMSQNGHK